MGYEKLSLTSLVKEIREVSDGAHPRRFCFVIGAGASRTSGIKSGQDLVKIWDIDLRERNSEEYERWRKELGITDRNMFSFYSQYYEKRFRRSPSDGYNYVEKIMESAKPSAGYVMLAHLLTTTPHNVVITTNFDHLTEDAVNYYAQNTPLVIGHEALAHYVSAQPVRPTIIKIHRDLLFDPKSRSEDLAKLPDNWKNALEQVFSNYHPVFIGYAGNDKSLMDFLIENSEKFASDEWKYPYWMLYKTDELEGSVKEFLEKSEGCYIEHSGFDNVLIQLGAAFDYQIPSEDSFLEDARKRYRALADAIDAMSDNSKEGSVNIPQEEGEKVSGSAEETDPKETNTDGVREAIDKIANQSHRQRQYRTALNLRNGQKYEDAAEILQKLVEQEPENARYCRSYGDVLRDMNKMEEALVQYDKAIELIPDDDAAHYWKGITLAQMGRDKEALAEFQTAIELAPNDKMNHYRAGRMLSKLERNEEALEEFQTASLLDPEDEFLHYAFGTALMHMRRYEEALDEYTSALKLAPDDAYNNYGQAKTLEFLGRYKEALAFAQKAVELDPSSEQVKEILKRIQDKLGDT